LLIYSALNRFVASEVAEVQALFALMSGSVISTGLSSPRNLSLLRFSLPTLNACAVSAEEASELMKRHLEADVVIAESDQLKFKK
jgi:hypothetical protein